MTDDTRDRDRPFADGGETAETTSDGRTGHSSSFGRADRTPAGTADSTRSTAQRPTDSDPSGAPGEDSNAVPNAGSNGDRLEERLRAVERALTGTDDAVADLGDEATASAEREELSTRLGDLEARVEELEAATQAIRGYVGSIRSVNQAVERRADLALAKASENGDAGVNGGTNARDGRAAGEVAIDDATADDALDGGVPSEADLDAAVPTDRRRGNERRSAAEPAVDRPETDGESAGDSWRSGALDRLRDSL
ncbi:hypothetical protein [Halorubrum sp. CSM-61]|uniref:DUF7310 family coiled-coil domain-containing protein n=1 Tax=Halorubrum sp. CSM-61 TaxID=2485838 RepID=UPI000F4B7861|nr:hypothetical protein [Halorubrum sp. CSM-61]